MAPRGPSRADTVARMPDLSRLVPRMRPYATTIFGQMSALATEVGAVNLGQGFPDVDGPQALKDIAVAAIVAVVVTAARKLSGLAEPLQYPPAHGLLDLRQAISEHQQHHYSLSVSAQTDVVVTTGASEALAAAVLALVGTGDEVIVLEPYFDLYAAIIALAGASCRTGTGLWRGVPAERAGTFGRRDSSHADDHRQLAAQSDWGGADRSGASGDRHDRA